MIKENLVNKQVNKSHYCFEQYMSKERFASVWHQLNEVTSLRPSNTLEVGPGPGFFKILAAHLGLFVETVDIDAELNPDHVASATDLPFEDSSYDCVCCFQMLEHLPYKVSLAAFKEFVRVSRRHIIISLPDAKRVWPQLITIPKVGQRKLLIPRPCVSEQNHEFDGEHYWEINKKGYPLKKVSGDFQSLVVCGKLLKTYRVHENPYHRFFVYEKS